MKPQIATEAECITIDWLTHRHVFDSKYGWQGIFFGSLVCECGYALPYETPQSRLAPETRARFQSMYGRDRGGLE